VVLESNKRKSKTGVVTEPELERNVESSLRKCVTRSTDLVRCLAITRSIHRGEFRVSKEGELSSLAHHHVVTALLIGIHRKLSPELHPVTILLVNTLTTNLNLNVINQLVTREIQPPSIYGSISADTHILINFGKSHLEICAVSKVSVTGNGAGHATTKITLSIESLFNGFHCKIGVAAISYLPVSNLWVTSKVNILSTISY
jgi:hypothetical protein